MDDLPQVVRSSMRPDQPMYTSRIGLFFFWVGVVLVFLFIFSDIAGQPAFRYFFIGALLVIIGAVIWWRSPAAPAEPADRFRTIKKLLKKKKKD